MSAKRRMLSVGAAMLLVCAVAVGCDSDEFDDAEFAAASDDGQAAGSPGDYGEDQPAVDEGRAMDSPGPVEGSERPADHPTLDDDQPGGGGGGSMGDAPAPQVDRPQPDQYGQEGPIRWEAPADWEPARPANQMRFAEYEIPADGGGDAAELTVFYFGEQGGGGVEDNLERWAGEFSGGSEPTRDELEVDGTTVHTLQVDGTREASMPMAGDGGPVDDQKLLGAVAETQAGLFFFRLVGDRATVAAQTEDFDAFVRSFEEGG